MKRKSCFLKQKVVVKSAFLNKKKKNKMSRSINGDGGGSNAVSLTVLDQTENKDYVFDSELLLYQNSFENQVTLKVDVNILYSWQNCTKASRFNLYIGESVFVCGVGDSIVHLNQIEKMVIVSAGADFRIFLKKDGKADLNDNIRIHKFSYVKTTVL